MPETKQYGIIYPIRPGAMIGNMEAALRRTITPQ